VCLFIFAGVFFIFKGRCVFNLAFAQPKNTYFKDMYTDRFIPARSVTSAMKGLFTELSSSSSISSWKNFSEEEPNQNTYGILLKRQVLHMSGPLNKVYKPIIDIEDVCTVDFSSRILSSKPCKSFSLSDLASASPLSQITEGIGLAHHERIRKVPTKPYQVLDAPQLKDDFYVNLIDWSKDNRLAVALEESIYLWLENTKMVGQLSYAVECQGTYTSVSWSDQTAFLAAGISDGKLQIWDCNTAKVIRNDLQSHTGRVGCLSWNERNILASGSGDRSIILRDMRIKGIESSIVKFKRHKQEVCGLKWSHNNHQLASGGNDNKLCIWNARQNTLEAHFNDHKAAVKALAWSPHQSGVLLSGGGTNDNTIKAWSIHTMKNLRSINTGSQVCSLLFSRNSNEFVSTHGVPTNHINLWDCIDFEKIGVLEGHDSRVLYSALSPNGETLVTGAGGSDETLQFWHLFPLISEEGKLSNLYPCLRNLR
jgi:cell division cycle 20-like protein 1 (cofactor of APC complex)